MTTATLPNTITPYGVTPTGERVVRQLDCGTLVFENYEAGEWVTQKGTPGKVARRRYTLDGEEFDSVSSIVGTLDKPALQHWLKDQSARGAVEAERAGALVGVVEEDYLKLMRKLGLGADAARDEGSDRGKAIHEAFHTLATEGRPPNPKAFPEAWRAWVQGAMRAWLALDPVPVASEQIACHPQLRYAGRPDLLAYTSIDWPSRPDWRERKLTLIDYKTGKGKVYDSAHYQTRLYALALLRCLRLKVDRIIIVGIDDDGGWQPVECEASAGDAISLIGTYRSRKRINAGMAAQRQLAKAAPCDWSVAA
jgi:hypothetical protein